MQFRNKKGKLSKRTLIIPLVLLLSANFVAIAPLGVNALTSSINYGSLNFTTDYHNDASISQELDYLKFVKSQHSHAQAKTELNSLENARGTSVSVRYYAYSMYSWSWGAVLMLSWPESGVNIRIKDTSGSNGLVKIYDREGVHTQTRAVTIDGQEWHNFRLEFGRDYCGPTGCGSGSYVRLIVDSVVQMEAQFGFYFEDTPVLYLGTDRVDDYSYIGSQEIFYYDDIEIGGGADVRDWESYPTNYGRNSPMEWIFQSSQGYKQEEISFVDTMSGGRSNVLKFNKYANHYAKISSSSYISLRNHEEFEVWVDYKPQSVNSWSWGPGIAVNWYNGEKAFIRDTSSYYSDYGCYGMSSCSRSLGMSNSIPEDGSWYRLSIKVTSTSLRLAYRKLDLQWNPETQSNIYAPVPTNIDNGWTVLNEYTRDPGALTSPFKVIIGVDRSDVYSSSGSPETYYFDNFEVLTGDIDRTNGNNEAPAYTLDDLEHRFVVSSPSYSWGTYDSRGDHLSDTYFDGGDPLGFCPNEESGLLFNVENNNIRFGKCPSWHDQTGTASTVYVNNLFNLKITKVQGYLPYYYAKSTKYWDQKVEMTNGDTQTSSVSTSLKVGTDVTYSSLTGSASFTSSKSSVKSVTTKIKPDYFMAKNGAVAVAYQKADYYVISGILNYNIKYGIVDGGTFTERFSLVHISEVYDHEPIIVASSFDDEAHIGSDSWIGQDKTFTQSRQPSIEVLEYSQNTMSTSISFGVKVPLKLAGATVTPSATATYKESLTNAQSVKLTHTWYINFNGNDPYNYKITQYDGLSYVINEDYLITNHFNPFV